MVNCVQPFVDVSYRSDEPWEIPAFYNRDLHPTRYNTPSCCAPSAMIRNENKMVLDRAVSTRNPTGGVEATMGVFTQRRFNPNVKAHIVQPLDVRFESIYSRMNDRYGQQYVRHHASA